MIFNSLEFIIFFPIVFILFYVLPLRLKPYFIFISSCIFYMWWKPVFIFLILSTIIITYSFSKILIQKRDRTNKKWILGLAVFFLLLPLLFFKYAEFFYNQLLEVLYRYKYISNPSYIDIILPVGISFYTFQAISYLIDLNKGKVAKEDSLLKIGLYLTFFPQLVAGPIERAKSLMPQFNFTKSFSYQRAVIGLREILMGLFMKTVIADRLAIYVDSVYNNVNHHSGMALVMATVFFSYQIYCDFAGYSLIAIGLAKMFNIKLMQNFNFPYFSLSISEFWRRWHISLSTWFRDYLYIPLGGNRKTAVRNNINLFITFFVSGIWHGANWTFLLWGSYHGLLLILEKRIKKYLKIKVPKIFYMLFVFLLSNIGWIFFRANSITDAILIFKKILTTTKFTGQQGFYAGVPASTFNITFVLLFLFIILEYITFSKILKPINYWNPFIRKFVYYLIIIIIIIFGQFGGVQFIYYQF